MKALTLTQPWATLVALGAKTIETRDWVAPDYMAGARLAIHAGKNLKPVDGEAGLSKLCVQPPFKEALFGEGTPYRDSRDLPRGAVLCIVTVAACVRTEDIDFEKRLPTWAEPAPDEHAFGNYGPGRWAWKLTEVEVLAEPIPARGMQKLWEWHR